VLRDAEEFEKAERAPRVQEEGKGRPKAGRALPQVAVDQSSVVPVLRTKVYLRR
jgi:hypothetical protein